MKTWEELAQHAAVIQKSVNELLQRHNTLISFLDAVEWDKDAKAVIDLLQEIEKDFYGFKEERERDLQKLEQERSQSPFFAKLFSSHSNEKETKEYITKSEESIQSIVTAIEYIQGLMDKTPSSKAEQKEIAGELRQLKSELTLQKREVNESLRQARAQARTKTASWTGVRGGMLGTIARYERASIRLDRERSLVPAEQMKAFFEQKLITLERDINWVMHFKGNGQEGKSQETLTNVTPTEILRCNYCGRRVNCEADVCPGCGANL